MIKLNRAQILPEETLPEIAELTAIGQDMAKKIKVGYSPFLSNYNVKSEEEYKQQQMTNGRIMLHGQIGYRDQSRSKRAYAEIYDKIDAAGYQIDRYGICLDWSMGYPKDKRQGMPKGTGLILNNDNDFMELTKQAPVAAHFGDFVMGTPAAFENTIAALKAGSTAIGNIGQYFNFRMPHWHDDITTTAETIKAIILCANQPEDILIHSNLDDGFAALFCDLTCAIGAALIEQYIIDDLLGARVSHCYGHTFSDPLMRIAFQRALKQISNSSGSMVYGNTTIYTENLIENYANLSSYLLPDIIAQMTMPSGHGLNPVPVTEALRIPDIDEIIDAHLFANRLITRADGYKDLIDYQKIDQMKDVLIESGTRFKNSVLNGLEEAGIDIKNPFELLLSIKRIGAKKLEELFGPGEIDKSHMSKRKPIILATTIAALEQRADEIINHLSIDDQEMLKTKDFNACIAATDVHEYGKILLEQVLNRIDLTLIDGGVSSDPDHVAEEALKNNASFIAISTYNGVALDYIKELQIEMKIRNLQLPIFIGGRLNQIKDGDSNSLPVDVSGDLQNIGVTVCLTIEDLLSELIIMAQRGKYY